MINIHKTKGHFVKSVIDGGPAVKSGLNSGDRLVCVNGSNVNDSTHEDVVAMVKKSGNKVVLLVIEPEGYYKLNNK